MIFYQLSKHPEHQAKIREELDAVSTSASTADLRQFPHLNAVIEEALRLHPPKPSQGQRVVGPEGITIGGRFVPPNTTILPARYALGRCTYTRTSNSLLRNPSLLMRSLDANPIYKSPQWKNALKRLQTSSPSAGTRSPTWSRTPTRTSHSGLVRSYSCYLSICHFLLPLTLSSLSPPLSTALANELTNNRPLRLRRQASRNDGAASRDCAARVTVQLHVRRAGQRGSGVDGEPRLRGC